MFIDKSIQTLISKTLANILKSPLASINSNCKAERDTFIPNSTPAKPYAKALIIGLTVLAISLILSEVQETPN